MTIGRHRHHHYHHQRQQYQQQQQSLNHPGWFRQHDCWSAHLFLGRPKFLLPVGVYSYTNVGKNIYKIPGYSNWLTQPVTDNF